MTKSIFLKRAAQKGAKVQKNNVHLAKPLKKVCGKIKLKSKFTFSFNDLVSC